MDASTARIGFIGFGNMAQAMAKGLVEHAGFDGGRITACAAHFDKLKASCKPLGANAVHTPAEVAEASDLVIVAVKPYMVADVLTPAREALAGKAVVSVAAGLLFDFYEDLLGAGSHHLSTIPNTPIAVGCGVIACEQKHSLATDEWETFTGLFGGIALIEPVAGHLLSTASAVAGCGPAFAAMFLESLADGGVKNGLPRATAYRLAAQMMAGTAQLHLTTGTHPGAMKDAVCSPGGTTIKGVAALEAAGLRNALISAVDATLRYRKGSPSNRNSHTQNALLPNTRETGRFVYLQKHFKRTVMHQASAFSV